MRPMGRSVIARCGGAGGGTISQRRSCDDQRRSIRRQGLLPPSSLARINGNHDGVVTASASGSDAVVMMCLGGGRRGALGMDNANEMNNWLDVSGEGKRVIRVFVCFVSRHALVLLLVTRDCVWSWACDSFTKPVIVIMWLLYDSVYTIKLIFIFVCTHIGEKNGFHKACQFFF